MIIDIFRDNVIPELNKGRTNKVNFIWGDSSYIREYMLTLKKGITTAPFRFPLVALYTPFEEQIDGFNLSASVNLIVAVNTLADYTNEQRLDVSFKKVLRPLYGELMKAIEGCKMFDVPYSGNLRHSYTENYSFGKRGALDVDGKEIDEKIDAIEIKNLGLTIKKLNCYANRL